MSSHCDILLFRNSGKTRQESGIFLFILGLEVRSKEISG